MPKMLSQMDFSCGYSKTMPFMQIKIMENKEEENPKWISKIIKLNKKEKVKTPSPKSTNEQTNKGL